MNTTSWIVCNAFLSRAGSVIKNKLISYLPKEEQELVENLRPSDKDPISRIYDKQLLLKLFHPTWFTSFLRTLPEIDVGLFLSSLPESVCKPIQSALLYSNDLTPLRNCGKNYLQDALIDTLFQESENIIPLDLLPNSPLNSLLELSHGKIQQLIEYLGIHDLAVEMKQIIDTVKIKKIHACLSEDKMAYLKSLSQKTEPVLFKRMELAKWDGTADALFTVVYHRGLNRLAKALSIEDPSLIWYISRTIPWQECNIFNTLCKPLNHPKAAALLSNQILEILPLIQKNSPKDLL